MVRKPKELCQACFGRTKRWRSLTTGLSFRMCCTQQVHGAASTVGVGGCTTVKAVFTPKLIMCEAPASSAILILLPDAWKLFVVVQHPTWFRWLHIPPRQGLATPSPVLAPLHAFRRHVPPSREWDRFATPRRPKCEGTRGSKPRRRSPPRTE